MPSTRNASTANTLTCSAVNRRPVANLVSSRRVRPIGFESSVSTPPVARSGNIDAVESSARIVEIHESQKLTPTVVMMSLYSLPSGKSREFTPGMPSA
jgi:hypothetical protein